VNVIVTTKSDNQALKTTYRNLGGGLYLKTVRSGKQTWLFRYQLDKKRQYKKIGNVIDKKGAKVLPSEFDCTELQARAKAERLLHKVKLGEDPFDKYNSLHNSSVEIIARDWLTANQDRWNNPQIQTRLIENYILPEFGNKKPSNISPMHVRDFLVSVKADRKPTVANDLLYALKQIFIHGIKLGMSASNPAQMLTANDAGGTERPRDRALNKLEIKTLLTACINNQNLFVVENYIAIIILLVLGNRKMELLSAEWEHFNFEDQIWNCRIYKKGNRGNNEYQKSEVRISLVIWDLFKLLKSRSLNSKFVFPSRRSTKTGHVSDSTLNAALNKMFKQGLLKIEHFVAHDLRRTCRTILSAQKVDAIVAEKYLNHELPKLLRIYDRHDYLDEKYEAQVKVYEYIKAILPDEHFALIDSVKKGGFI
jgi:integrase